MTEMNDQLSLENYSPFEVEKVARKMGKSKGV